MRLALRSTDARNHLLMVIIAISGAGLMLWATALYGVGAGVDSAGYIGAAKVLLAGGGLSGAKSALSAGWWPPIYPILVAVAARASAGTALQGARIVAALFTGLNVLLVGLTAYFASGRKILWSLATIGMAFVLPQTWQVLATAWSESVFIGFSFLGILALARYVEGAGTGRLYLGAAAIGVAILTRYLGVALLPVLVAAAWWTASQSLKSHVARSIYALALACAPLGVWIFVIPPARAGIVGRAIVAQKLDLVTVRELLGNFAAFLLPGTWAGKPASLWPLGLGVVLAVVLAVLPAIPWRFLSKPRLAGPSGILRALFGIAALSCIAVIYLGGWLTNRQPDLTPRMLLPAYLPALTVIMGLLGDRAGSRRIAWVAWSGLLLALTLTAVRIMPAAQQIAGIHDGGSGFTSAAWQDSPTIAFVRDLGPEVQIFSNVPPVLSLLIERDTNSLSDEFNSRSLSGSPKLDSLVQTTCQRLAAADSVVVFFAEGGPSKARELPLPQQVVTQCGLSPLAEFPDAKVFGTTK